MFRDKTAPETDSVEMCASEIRLLANEWQLRSGRVVFAFDLTKC